MFTEAAVSFSWPCCLSSENSVTPLPQPGDSGALDLPLPEPLPAPGWDHVSCLVYNYPGTFLESHRSSVEQQQAVRGTSAWHSITGHAVMQNTAYSKRFTGLQSAWPLVSEDMRHGANSKQHSGGKGVATTL